MFFSLAAFLVLGNVHADDSSPTPAATPTPPALVRIAAPVSLRLYLVNLAGAIQTDKGVTISISASLTSAGALDALGQGNVDIAMMTRPLTGEDRALYPSADLDVVQVGMEAVALGVSDDVWDSNLHSVTRQMVKDIYEGKVKNWRDLGGPDEKIVRFYMPQGQGIWEIFAEWLYGDNRKAPLPFGRKSASSLESRDDLELTDGAFAPLAAGYIDGKRYHALGLMDEHGAISRPVPTDVAQGKYPIVRPINAVVVGLPTLDVRTVTEYMTGPDGQGILKKTGALGADAAATPTPNPYY